MRKSHRRNPIPLTLSLLSALAVVAMPYGPVTEAPFAFAEKAAFARGGGGGGGQGGGQGGGHGGGKGGGKGQGQLSAEDTRGHGMTKGGNHALSGRVNAAHASERARERAADHSAVGRMAAYEAALEEDNLAEAAAALAAVANKTVNQAVVEAVNELLGVETTLDSADIADLAAAAQAESNGSNGLGHGPSEEPDYSDAVLN